MHKKHTHIYIHNYINNCQQTSRTRFLVCTVAINVLKKKKRKKKASTRIEPQHTQLEYIDLVYYTNVAVAWVRLVIYGLYTNYSIVAVATEIEALRAANFVSVKLHIYW